MAEDPGSPDSLSLSAILSQGGGSEVLISHDDGLIPGVGAIHPSNVSLLLPEAHPVLLNRPPGTSPLGISASKALPVSSNRQIMRQQQNNTPAGWLVHEEEANLDDLPDEFDPSGESILVFSIVYFEIAFCRTCN
jgi:hypothetical protein